MVGPLSFFYRNLTDKLDMHMERCQARIKSKVLHDTEWGYTLDLTLTFWLYLLSNFHFCQFNHILLGKKIIGCFQTIMNNAWFTNNYSTK